MFKFKPEDFSWDHWFSPAEMENIANKANALLEAHLKTLPRVYKTDRPGYAADWAEHRFKDDDYTALLWGVEEIK